MYAREFYYNVIAPAEKGKSYQEHHISEETHTEITESMSKIYGHDYPEIRRKQVAEFIPTYSNDELLDSLMAKIITYSDSDEKLKNRLKNTFIVKVNNLKAVAFVNKGNKEYTGDLAFFFVGMSDASFQYSILYYELITCVSSSNSTNSEERIDLARILSEVLTVHADQLARAQLKWVIKGDYVKLEKELMLESSDSILREAAHFSAYIDLFVICHEMSHHLLGHSGNENLGKQYLRNLPEKYKFWKLYDIEDHIKEVQADILALYLLIGANNGWKKIVGISDYTIEDRIELLHRVVAGPLLFFTMIGQFVENIYNPSKTHPSVLERYTYVFRIVTELFSLDYGEIVSAIAGFQRILYTTQKRGIGMTINKDDL